MLKFLDKHLIFCTLIWVLVIFILCATPGQYIPNFSWLDLLSFDKFVHATMFFILSSLFFLNGFKREKAKSFFILFLFIAILYGLSLEIMQATIFINRTADWNDMIANSFGATMAFVFKNRLSTFYKIKIRTI